jgi:hypothetical protein
MNGILVRYKIKPEYVEQNRELVSGFLDELSTAQLANRYAVFTLADSVSFVHVHLFATDAEENQFTRLPAFRAFEKHLGERCEELPVVNKLEAVGSYGWFEESRGEPAHVATKRLGTEMKTVLVRYKVKPDHAERNRELVRAVYGDLELTQPADFNYATFALDDGVSFVHLAAHGYETNPLAELPAFLAFQAGIRERCDEQPVVTEVDAVGSYGWSPPTPHGIEVTHSKGEEDMKFALMIYPGTMAEAMGQLSEEERTAVMNEYRALGQEPDIFFSEQLQAADRVVTVRVEDGRTLTSEGAFADQDIGGLYLLEADGIDRALELAARFPAARLGGAVEVRPIVER